MRLRVSRAGKGLRLLGQSVELPMRPRGVPNGVGVRHADAAAGALGGAPHGAAKRVRGMPTWVRVSHADAAAGAFGGAP
eukprot:8837538-Pyramimonas_sp.AAC.2